MRRLILAAVLPLALGGCTAMLSQQGQDTLAEMRAVTDADMAQAYQLALLNNDKPAMQCLVAIRTVVLTLRTFTVAGPMTLVQAGMDVTSPTGYLQVECAAQKAAIRSRIAMLTAKAGALFASFGLTAGS